MRAPEHYQAKATAALESIPDELGREVRQAVIRLDYGDLGIRGVASAIYGLRHAIRPVATAFIYNFLAEAAAGRTKPPDDTNAEQSLADVVPLPITQISYTPQSESA